MGNNQSYNSDDDDKNKGTWTRGYCRKCYKISNNGPLIKMQEACPSSCNCSQCGFLKCPECGWIQS